MPATFKVHRIAAFVVLVGAAAWILTGEFSSVGSAEGPPQSDNRPVDTSAPDTQAVAGPALRTVSVLVPEFIDHERTIRISGTTNADKRALLAARSDGVIQSLDLTKGMPVVAGAVVMTLEGPEALAQKKSAEIALAQRERDLEVADRLYAGGNSAETQVTAARSARDAARAELERADAAVDRLELRAPFAGIVTTVEIELGEWVQTGAPVASILSLDPIIVQAEVSEVDVGSVASGSKATITLVNGTRMDGIVRLVSRDASVETRTFPVEIALPNPGNALPAGMSAEVAVLAGPQRAVIVPRSVVTLAETGEVGLRIIDEDDIALFVPVDIIDDIEAGLVVTGVPEDVRIIVAGQDLVRDGEKVVVAEPDITK